MSTKNFSGLRKSLIAAAAGVLLSFGVASAVEINVNFNTQFDGIVLVKEFDWSSAGSGVPIYAADNPTTLGNDTGTPVLPGQTLLPGQLLTFDYQASLANMLNPASAQIPLPNLNGAGANNYEITAIGILNEVITGFSVDANGNQTANFQITGGTLKIFFDTNVNSNVLAGTGFEDGTLILTATQASGTSSFTFCPVGQPCQNLPPGTGGTGQGSSTTELIVAGLAYDQTFFLTSLLHDLDFTTQLRFPPGTSATTCFFCSPDANGFPSFDPDGGLVLKADASNVFTAEKVPEAGSLVLFGSGLLGLVSFLRRRNLKAK